MSDQPDPDSLTDTPEGGSWRLRLAVAVLILMAIGVVLVTNRWLSERFTETTRNRAELRLALYSGNMLSEPPVKKCYIYFHPIGFYRI